MTLPLAGLRIGLLTASASRAGGGVFEAVVQQAAMIRDLGGEPWVFALRDRFSDRDAPRFADMPLTHCKVVGPAQIGFAPGLVGRLISAELDVLHLHGVWTWLSRAASLWARRSGRRYLISTHGMLDPATITRRRWKKRIGEALFERANWKAAWAFHALTAQEAANVRAAAGSVETFVIPNPVPAQEDAITAPRAPRIVYLGRIHPIKNLDSLLEGWKQAEVPPDARLTIAGWGDPAAVARLEAQVATAGSTVEFIGPAFGQAKADLLGRAKFMVLPSLSEAMPMAVLEGWAMGVPAILTSNCNLPEGVAAGAALECGRDPASIGTAITAALQLDPVAWRAMSKAAQALASGPFSLTTVAAQWAAAYRGKPLPGKVSPP